MMRDPIDGERGDVIAVAFVVLAVIGAATVLAAGVIALALAGWLLLSMAGWL